MNKIVKKKYDVILFDLDGTLADTDLIIIVTYLQLFDRYRSDYPITLPELLSFSGPPVVDTLTKYFPMYDLEEMTKIYHKTSESNYEKYIRSFPLMKETLLKLKEVGYRLGIITGKRYEPSLTSLRLLDVEPNMFELIIGADNMEEQKPHPSAMEQALQRLNVGKEDVLYIGDNTTDYLFAKNAGVDSGIVMWTLRKLDENIKPKYFFNSFKEIEEELV